MLSEFLRNTEINWLLRSSDIFCLRIIPHIFVILLVNGFQDARKYSRCVKVVVFKDNLLSAGNFISLKRYRAFWGHSRIQMLLAICSESVFVRASLPIKMFFTNYPQFLCGSQLYWDFCSSKCVLFCAWYAAWSTCFLYWRTSCDNPNKHNLW